MRRHSVKQIFAMGTFCITDTKDQSSLIAYLMVSIIWMFGRSTWQQVVNIGKTFNAKDLDWTIYRLGLVTNGGDGHTCWR